MDYLSRNEVNQLINATANKTMTEIVWEFGGDDDHRIYMIEGMALFLEKLQQTFGEKEVSNADT